MAEALKLSTETKPTLFNKEMAIGLLAGLMMPVGVAWGFAASAAGAVIGGMAGKARMENEYLHGKTVKEPSYWNKDTAIGSLAGAMLGEAVAVIAAAFTGAPASALATLGGLVGGTLVGGYIGGAIGKKEMELEQEKAKQQLIVRQVSQNISPEIGQAVAYTMEHKKDWGKQMLEEKLLAAAQDPQR